MNRRQLETLIEKTLHNFMTEIKEHVVDFTVLTLRKKDPKVDLNQLGQVLDVVKMAMEDGFMTRIDRFMKTLSPAFDDLEAQSLENPTERPTTPGKKSKNS